MQNVFSDDNAFPCKLTSVFINGDKVRGKGRWNIYMALVDAVAGDRIQQVPHNHR